MCFSNFFSRMTNQKEQVTSTLTSDQNQNQKGKYSNSQLDQDQNAKPGYKRSTVSNDQQNPSKKTKIEMGERSDKKKKDKII